MARKELEQCKGIPTILPEGITIEDLNLSTTDGFKNRYIKHLKTSRTCEEAFNKTASDYRRIFQKERYASYDSFRVTINRRLKSK